MWKVCPKCNHLNSDDSAKCEQCGARLPAIQPEAKPFAMRTDEIPSVAEQPTPIQVTPPAIDITEPSPPPPDGVTIERRANVKFSLELRRRNGAAVATAVVMVVVLAMVVAYGVGESLCNAFFWLVAGLILLWITHSLWKNKWSGPKTVAVVVLLLVPVVIAAFAPWQSWADQIEEQNRKPIFVDHITSSREGTHITVSGYVSNDGDKGGQAMVRITAYGGYPANDDELSKLTGAFAQGYVSTGWIEPGGSAGIHWECTLSYWNGMGDINWQIIDSSQN